MTTVRGKGGQDFSIGGKGRPPKIPAGRQGPRRPQADFPRHGGRLQWPTPHTAPTAEEEVLTRGVEQHRTKPTSVARNQFLPAGDLPYFQLIACGISQERSILRESDRTVTALRTTRCFVKGADHACGSDFKNLKPICVPRMAGQPLVVRAELQRQSPSGDADQLAPALEIPEPYGPIKTGGSQQISGVIESHFHGFAVVAFQHSNQFSAPAVPKVHQSVLTRAG